MLRGGEGILEFSNRIGLAAAELFLGRAGGGVKTRLRKVEVMVGPLDRGGRGRDRAAGSHDPARHGGYRVSPGVRSEPTPKVRSLRWRAERSMPTNSAVFEMLPPKRLIWATR
jgi:hypothetical protein